jgi:hypothetical protein
MRSSVACYVVGLAGERGDRLERGRSDLSVGRRELAGGLATG